MVKRREFIVGGGGAAVIASALAADQSASHQKMALRNDIDRTNFKGGAAGDSRRLTQSYVLDASYIDARLDSRSVSFENPTGARGSGGKVGNGRKWQPFYILEPGERIVLADLAGPGTLRHVWMTFSKLSPESARAQRLEIFYEGLAEPSVSVPVLDFFGLPHGRFSEYYSALISINNGSGLNSHIPMPFQRSMRVEYANESKRHVHLFYQVDYTLEQSVLEEPSYLHVSFRRENPTTLLRDFVLVEGLKGPGRFLGCAVGICALEKGWYGEGEVKIYRDGDQAFPTYCGTGLEDYVGSAWGAKRHYGPYGGVPINILEPASDSAKEEHPKLISFYRWHLPDPIMFSETIRVTIQQIGGSEHFTRGQESAYAAYKAKHVAAGAGWVDSTKLFRDSLGFAIVERSDDYSAAAFVYCREPQPVPRYTTDVAVRDVGWLASEKKSDAEMSEDEWEEFSIEFKKHWGAQLNRHK